MGIFLMQYIIGIFQVSHNFLTKKMSDLYVV